jgi:hypothetical protein
VTLLLAIVTLWLMLGVAWLVFFSLLRRRPLTETDRWCGRIDRALLREYGPAR